MIVDGDAGTLDHGGPKLIAGGETETLDHDGPKLIADGKAEEGHQEKPFDVGLEEKDCR